MFKRHDPDGSRLPIKLDTTSNGEFMPRPLAPVHHRIHRDALQAADRNARRTGLKRRDFLVSACGAATTLLSMNAAYASVGRRGGYYDLPGEAVLDPDLAAASLDGDEFIFDVQGHFVNPRGDWLKQVPESAKPLSGMPKAGCALADDGGPRSYLDCLGPTEFIKDVFLDSDTDLVVLSFVPSRADAEPLTIEEAANVQALVEQLEGSHRLLLHGRVNPNQDGDLARMDELAERWGVAAWKTYTQWGPDGQGYFLDDDVGLAFIEKARALGVRNIAIHKGIPFGRQSYEHSLCDDIGRVALRYPDVNFLIYHSGFVPGQAEGAFDPDRNEGVDSLIKSLLDNDIAPNSNVYAELGSTWRFLLRDPDSAAHTLGKLLRHVGENNVLWGTDSIWYGSPQDQIQAFRSFQIAEELREAHGYPQLTPQLRAKVFGLNALTPYPQARGVIEPGDAVASRRQAYRADPDPHYLTYGPRSRREFLNLKAWGG